MSLHPYDTNLTQSERKQLSALKFPKYKENGDQEVDGNILNPSGLPPPEIEGLAEMQYKDFLIPEEYQDSVFVLFSAKNYKKLWALIGEALPDLPHGEKMEVINKFMDNNGDFRLLHVRVHKPRKKINTSF